MSPQQEAVAAAIYVLGAIAVYGLIAKGAVDIEQRKKSPRRDEVDPNTKAFVELVMAAAWPALTALIIGFMLLFVAVAIPIAFLAGLVAFASTSKKKDDDK